MGITIRTLKSGEQVYLCQKLLNNRRINKVFRVKKEAKEWMEEKEKEKEKEKGALVPSDKEKMKTLDKKIVRLGEDLPFQEEDLLLFLFRKNSNNIPDRDFILLFNSVSSYERTEAMTLRYKEIIKVLREKGE